MIRAINLYVDDGIPTGSFLEAVLSNDLMEAFGRADMDNRLTIFHITSYIYNELPSRSCGCWGSPEAYNSWIWKGGLNGIAKSHEESQQKLAKVDG